MAGLGKKVQISKVTAGKRPGDETEQGCRGSQQLRFPAAVHRLEGALSRPLGWTGRVRCLDGQRTLTLERQEVHMCVGRHWAVSHSALLADGQTQ